MKALSSARAAHRALGAAHELEPARRAHRVGAGAVLAGDLAHLGLDAEAGEGAGQQVGGVAEAVVQAGGHVAPARRSPRRSATARGRRRRGRRRGARSAGSRRRARRRPPRRSPGAGRRGVRRPASAPAGRAGPSARARRAPRAAAARGRPRCRGPGRSGNESRSRYTPGVSAAAPRGPPGPRARPSARRRPCSPASSRTVSVPAKWTLPTERRSHGPYLVSTPGATCATGQPRVQRSLVQSCSM